MPEKLRAMSVSLLWDLKLVYERLDRNTRNSSRPPCGMAPWERSDSDIDADQPAAPASGDEATAAEQQVAETPADDVASQVSRPAAEPTDEDDEQHRPGGAALPLGMGARKALPSTTSSRITLHTAPVAVPRSPPRRLSAVRTPSGLAIDLHQPNPERPALEVMKVRRASYEQACPWGHRPVPRRAMCAGRWRLAGGAHRAPSGRPAPGGVALRASAAPLAPLHPGVSRRLARPRPCGRPPSIKQCMRAHRPVAIHSSETPLVSETR